jgi:hypothetical protein
MARLTIQRVGIAVALVVAVLLLGTYGLYRLKVQRQMQQMNLSFGITEEVPFPWWPGSPVTYYGRALQSKLPGGMPESQVAALMQAADQESRGQLTGPGAEKVRVRYEFRIEPTVSEFDYVYVTYDENGKLIRWSIDNS